MSIVIDLKCDTPPKKPQQSIEKFRFKMSIVIDLRRASSKYRCRVRTSMTIDILRLFRKSQHRKALFRYLKGLSLLTFKKSRQNVDRRRPSRRKVACDATKNDQKIGHFLSHFRAKIATKCRSASAYASRAKTRQGPVAVSRGSCREGRRWSTFCDCVARETAPNFGLPSAAPAVGNSFFFILYYIVYNIIR